MITVQQFDILAQKAHTLAGLAAVFGTAALFGKEYVPYAALAILLFAAGREFWYDYEYESEEERGSSRKDFAYYSLGTIVALVAVYGRAYV